VRNRMFWTLFSPQSAYKKQARFAAILWTLLIFVLCLFPGKELPHSDIPFIDKWVHFLLFGPFCFLWLCAYPLRRFRNLFLALLAGCLLGYIVELLQGAFPALGRSKDTLDIVADGVGSFLGTLLFYIAATIARKQQPPA